MKATQVSKLRQVTNDMHIVLLKTISSTKYKQESNPQPSIPHAPCPITKPLSSAIPLVRRSPQPRPRKRITHRIPINIKPNPRITLTIQRRARNTPTRLHTPTAPNLDVQALHIQLRAIILAPTVQRNDLVANDVIPGREFGRQDGADLEVVLDHGVGDPGAGGDDGGLAEFGPAEGGGG